jgi:hypothetical protein
MTNPVASLATIPLAALTENGDAQAPRVYRLMKPFAAVKFEAEEKGRIVFLPEGAEVRIVGPSAVCKCVEVVYDRQIYNIFQVDLLGPWSTPVRDSRRGMVRVKGIGACA